MATRQSNYRNLLLVGGLVVIAWLVIGFNGRVEDWRRLTAEQANVKNIYAGRLATTTALKAQMIYATSDLAVERWAYEDERMVRKGDNPVVPLAAQGTTPTPTAQPPVTPTPQNNPQSWWDLFFGP